jgi:hypothetical protein
MTRIAILLASAVALASCKTSDLSQTQQVLAQLPAALQGACSTALAAANLASGTVRGGAANTVAQITAGVVVGCTTAEGIAKLAADPSSTEWLGIQTGTLNAVASAAKSTS